MCGEVYVYEIVCVVRCLSSFPSFSQTVLQQQCLELRSQVISLHTQMDTSQTVQKDFVQLSQSLQVRHGSWISNKILNKKRLFM